MKSFFLLMLLSFVKLESSLVYKRLDDILANIIQQKLNGDFYNTAKTKFNEIAKARPKEQSIGNGLKNKADKETIIIGELFYTYQGFLTIPINVAIPFQQFNLFFNLDDFVMYLPAKGATNYTPVDHFFDSNTDNFTDSFEPFLYQNSFGACYATFVRSFFSIHEGNLYYDWLLCREIALGYNGADGSFGFDRSIDNDTNAATVLSQLYYYQEIIPYLVFSIKPPDSINETPMIFIGNYHRDFDDLTVHIAYYNLTTFPQEERFWQMNNTAIVYGNYEYPYNITHRIRADVPIQFSTSLPYLYFPENFTDDVLAYLPNDCKKELQENNFYLIICPNLTQIKNISLEFSPYLVNLPKETYWVSFDDKKTYVLQILFFINLSKIILGVPFFKNYHVLFDHENSQVRMYPLNDGKVIDLNYIPPTSDSNFWLIFSIILGVVVIGVIIGGVIIWKRQQKKKASVERPIKEYEIGTLQ